MTSETIRLSVFSLNYIRYFSLICGKCPTVFNLLTAGLTDSGKLRFTFNPKKSTT